MDVHESTSPLGYVSILGETGEPTLGWKEGSGANPRVTFDRKVRNLGKLTFCLCPQIQFPPTSGPTPFRQPTVSDNTENLTEYLNPLHQCLLEVEVG